LALRAPSVIAIEIDPDDGERDTEELQDIRTDEQRGGKLDGYRSVRLQPTCMVVSVVSRTGCRSVRLQPDSWLRQDLKEPLASLIMIGSTRSPIKVFYS
jgi:hypothetical protein